MVLDGFTDGIKSFFRRHNRMVAGFHDSAGEFFIRTVKYRGNTFTIKIAGEHHEYVVDPSRTKLHRKYLRPYAEYYVGNPEPIKFLYAKNPDVDSVGLRRIIEDKSIIDLFSNQQTKAMMLILILLIVIIVLGIVSILVGADVISFGGNTTGVPP